MTRLREVVVRAQRIGGHSRKPKTYPAGRTCEVCGAFLNSYNKGSRCIPHSHAVFTKYRAVHKQGA